MRPRGSPKVLERRRYRAIKMLEKGKDASAVAKQVGVSVSSVLRWKRTYEESGPGGLASRPVPGRPSKLSDKQRKDLVKVLEAGPRAMGYDTDIWTSRLVREVIEKKFKVTYHANYIWRILAGLGWSYQKRARRAKAKAKGRAKGKAKPKKKAQPRKRRAASRTRRKR